MRVGILPITSFRHLAGESEVVMFNNQLRSWSKHEDYWGYIILPKDCEDQGWIGEVEKWPRTSVVWADRLGLYYDKLVEIPVSLMELANMRNGILQLDLLVTSRRATTIGMMRELWDHRLPKTFPVVIDESMTAEFGLTPSQTTEIDLMAQTLGYAYGYPVWDTETQKKNAMAAARRYVSGDMARRIIDKGVVIPCGFDPSRTKRVLDQHDTTKNERFTCFFGGRLNAGSKRAPIMLREYDSFFRFGRDVDIKICSPKAEGWMLDTIKQEYPEIEILTEVSSDEFKVRASKAHVFLNTSAHEGFSVGFAEMMWMTQYGTVLLAPRTHWVQGMFQEKFDEYPFLYNSFEEARIMLRWVYENYEEAVRKSSWLGKWVAEKYDMEYWNEQHFLHYQNVVKEETNDKMVYGLMSESNRELTQKALGEMDSEFFLSDLYGQMIEMSNAMKADPRRGQCTQWSVRKWLMHEGIAADLYDGPKTRMRKL